MDRDFIGVRDEIIRNPSEHGSNLFTKKPSSRSLLFRRFLSIFCCRVSHMTPATPRRNMQTFGSERGYGTASETICDSDSGHKSSCQCFQRSKSSKSVSLEPWLSGQRRKAFDQLHKSPQRAPSTGSMFPPVKSVSTLTGFNNLYSDQVNPIPDTKMSSNKPVRSVSMASEDLGYETASESSFTETDLEQRQDCGDQNLHRTSSYSKCHSFPAQHWPS